MWDKKLSTENSEIPLITVSFSDTRFFLKHRTVALRFFLVLSDTDFDKNRIASRSSLIHKIFLYPKFPETQTCSPTKLLESVGQNFNSRKKWYPLLIRKFFRNSLFFWTTEGFPFETFRYCETKNLTKNRDTTPSSFGTVRQKLWQKSVIHQPLLLSTKIFDTRNFWKTDVFPYETFGLSATKNYLHKKLISPSYA